jgi:D-psicose/D-tagatose/L-ribulose 3-epimerase
MKSGVAAMIHGAAAARDERQRLLNGDLGEPNWRPPGRGRMPWTEIFGALGQIKLSGSVGHGAFLIPGVVVGRYIAVYRYLPGSDNLEAIRSVQLVRSEQKKAQPNQ